MLSNNFHDIHKFFMIFSLCGKKIYIFFYTETQLLYCVQKDYGVTRFHKIFYVSRRLLINPIFDIYITQI